MEAASLVDENSVKTDLLVHLARLGLAGRAQDVQAYLRQSIRKVTRVDSALAARLSELLAIAPTASAPLREAGGRMVPIDADSRLALLKHENPVILDADPILSASVKSKLEQVVAERRNASALEKHGLAPTRSLLFVGPPGVGKTLCARWLACRLERPLLSLDLATVMSSYLGKTGSNIRAVLDYSKSVECVLLLDEFDAVAKRRDDEAELGELKRLVTVLLQEVDDWPSTSLLIAATNHPELLDPAAWRRFDDVLAFERPTSELRQKAIADAFAESAEGLTPWLPFLVELWQGQSYSDIARTARSIRRKAAIEGVEVTEALIEALEATFRSAPATQRREAAQLLIDSGLSDRRVSQLTSVSRDTLRRSRQPGPGKKG